MSATKADLEALVRKIDALPASSKITLAALLFEAGEVGMAATVARKFADEIDALKLIQPTTTTNSHGRGTADLPGGIQREG